jgi:hypothetical protein
VVIELTSHFIPLVALPLSVNFKETNDTATWGNDVNELAKVIGKSRNLSTVASVPRILLLFRQS